MAEEQKPVEVAAPVAVEETTPAVAPEEAPAVETPAPVTEDTPATEDKPAETAEETEAPKEEEKPEEEVKPIEEGTLAHKAQGASFPKNLISSKTFFFFGSDAFDPKSLAAYLKGEKHAETAHHNAAWASHSGKGLLFFGDKKAPHGIINLADASEPEVDGSNKFNLTAKNNKHSFKAATAAERDNWVAQLKAKIAEAKEFAATVTESEIYKQTVESFKPAAPVKEEKAEETPAEEAKPEEAVATEEPATEEAKPEEEAKVDEPAKRRSASRKRASFFGFGKKELKEEEPKTEEAVSAEPPVIAEPVVETEDAAVAPEEPAAVEPVPAPVAETEDKPAEEDKLESPKEKPTVNKRNSFFGNVFSKKEKKVAEVKAEAADAVKEAEPATSETAPVIPPVDTTTPLAVEVSTPAEPAAETVESPVTDSEAKKEAKEKRKSSLPFVFGKRDKSPAPPSDGEEKSKSAFSKLRATIKGKSAAKAEEKPAEEAPKEEEEIKEETAAVEEPVVEEAPKVEETEAKPAEEVAPAPVVTAAA